MRHFRHVFQFILVLLSVFFAPGQLGLSGENASASAASVVHELIGGQTLVTFCASRADVDLGICNGYIMAIAEAMTGRQTVFGQQACGHDGIKADQLVELVKLDIHDNPSIRRQKAGPMVAQILAKNFPCGDAYDSSVGGWPGDRGAEGASTRPSTPLASPMMTDPRP